MCSKSLRPDSELLNDLPLWIRTDLRVVFMRLICKSDQMTVFDCIVILSWRSSSVEDATYLLFLLMFRRVGLLLWPLFQGGAAGNCKKGQARNIYLSPPPSLHAFGHTAYKTIYTSWTSLASEVKSRHVYILFSFVGGRVYDRILLPDCKYSSPFRLASLAEERGHYQVRIS